MIEEHTRRIAEALDVRGLINVQYAVKGSQVFVIEANPRASRTVPFVAKATGVPLVKVAARVMVGATLAELRDEGLLVPPVDRRPRRGQGGGAAVQPLPRRRPRARAGDALDRRGHGHRRDLRPGLRQEPDRGGRPAARAAARVFLSLADRDKAHRPSRPPAASPSSASRSPPPPAPPTRLEAAGVAGARPAWPSSGRGAATDARRPHRGGRGHAGGQQPAGPRAPGRRRATSARPPACAGIPCLTTAAAGAGRGQRHGRLGRATSCGSGRCRSTTPGVRAPTQLELSSDLDAPGRRWTRRRSVDLTHPGRVGGAAEPGDDGVGHRRATAPSSAATSTSASLGRGGREVAVGRAVGRQPGAPGPRDGRRGCSTASACRARASRRGWRDDLPAAARPPGRGSWPASGAARSRTTSGRPTLLADAPAGGRRGRGQPVVPERRGAGGHVRPLGRRPPRRSMAATAGVRAAAVGQAQPERHRPRRHRGRGRGEAGAEAVTLVNTVMGMAIDVETRALPARRRRRRAVGPGHPPGRGAGRARRATPRCPDLPIVGVGGVVERRATRSSCCWPARRAVQVGTATFADPARAARVLTESGRLVPAPRRAGASAS